MNDDGSSGLRRPCIRRVPLVTSRLPRPCSKPRPCCLLPRCLCQSGLRRSCIHRVRSLVAPRRAHPRRPARPSCRPPRPSTPRHLCSATAHRCATAPLSLRPRRRSPDMGQPDHAHRFVRPGTDTMKSFTDVLLVTRVPAQYLPTSPVYGPIVSTLELVVRGWHFRQAHGLITSPIAQSHYGTVGCASTGNRCKCPAFKPSSASR